tara:strand:- start:95 stop:649 length:555 start_codon:yes stop_codon:yes gene_type:complete
MRVYIICIILVNILIGGCYPKALNYDLGWGTRTIKGNVQELNSKKLKSMAFIIVLEYYSKFIKFENESRLYTPRARIVFPEKNGDYLINFDLKATVVDLTFVASGYNMERFRFRRQFGIGDLRYEAKLTPSQIWANEFVLQIAPFLENFILEQRYRMADSQQLFLGDWMATERERFSKLKEIKK